MRVIGNLTFADVMHHFRHEHDAYRVHRHNSNSEAMTSMINVDKQLREWHKVLLGPGDVRRVILPHHSSEGGAIELVPPNGLTVRGAGARLSGIKQRFADGCPACWDKISRARLQPIFLSSIANNVEPYYSNLDDKEGLIHLDGLHRMVAWELFGWLTDGFEVEAYIAGPLSRACPVPSCR